MDASDAQRLLEWVLWPSIPLLYGLAVLWILTPTKEDEMNVWTAIHGVSGLTIGSVETMVGDKDYYTRKITVKGPDGTDHEITLFSDRPEKLETK